MGQALPVECHNAGGSGWRLGQDLANEYASVGRNEPDADLVTYLQEEANLLVERSRRHDKGMCIKSTNVCVEHNTQDLLFGLTGLIGQALNR